MHSLSLAAMVNLSKKYVIALCLCSVLLPLYGQVQIDSIFKQYPFLKAEHHGLQLFNDSSAYHLLFEKIYRINQGSNEQIHIVHVGGSHVQAGILSERLRSRFRALLEPHQVGERGFLFPYALAGTNNPWDYNIDFSGSWVGCRNAVNSASCRWGVAGIVASTTTPYSTIKVVAKDPILGVSTFCSARVYYDVDTDPYHVEVINWDCPVYHFIDTLGGYIEWHFESEQRELEIRITPMTDTLSAPFNMQGVQLMTGYPGITLHAIGVNGASVPSYLRCEKFATQLCGLQPDLIIFGIGVNDANTTQKDFNPQRFEDHYDQLLKGVCDCQKEPAFLFLTNNDTYYKKKYPNKNALAVRMVMQNLALRYGGGVYDVFGMMGGLQSIQKWQQAGLAKKDYIHFTNDGYRLLGDLIFAAFERQYVEFVNDRLNQTE